MAMVPRASVPDSATIERMRGCLGVRLVLDEWHAVFNGSPEVVDRELRSVTGMNGIRCVSLPLERLRHIVAGGPQTVHEFNCGESRARLLWGALRSTDSADLAQCAEFGPTRTERRFARS
jgi:hypothetical protein